MTTSGFFVASSRKLVAVDAVTGLPGRAHRIIGAASDAGRIDAKEAACPAIIGYRALWLGGGDALARNAQFGASAVVNCGAGAATERVDTGLPAITLSGCRAGCRFFWFWLGSRRVHALAIGANFTA